MANKQGLGDKGRPATPTSNQKSCKGSCHNKSKGDKAHYLEEDEEFNPCASSESTSSHYKKTSAANPSKPGNSYRLAQRPGEDEDEDDYEDEDEDEDDDYDDEDDEDDDEDYEEEDEDYEEEEELSTKKASQYVLKYGVDSLMSNKKNQMSSKLSQNSNRSNPLINKERKTTGQSNKKVRRLLKRSK